MEQGLKVSSGSDTKEVDMPVIGEQSISIFSMMKKETRTAVHYLKPEQLAAIYCTDLEFGLTDAYAAGILVRDGPNKLREVKGIGIWKMIRRNLLSAFHCVLWILVILSFTAYGVAVHRLPKEHSENEYLYVGLILTGTILGTGLFGIYQDMKNKCFIEGFNKMLPQNTTVIRQGEKKVILNSEVVVGDIVEMNSGEIVPADVRILECMNFKTSTALLTGNFMTVLHTTTWTDDNPIESTNMAFFSCLITEGRARGLVVDTGEFTQIGKIAGLVTGLKKKNTPLAKEITRLITVLCLVAFILGGIFFGVVYSLRDDWLIAFRHMLGIILANIPVGLLVTVTVCTTLTSQNLMMKHCLVKHLLAVETLGSISCICTDKTGTLTQNRMSVSHLSCDFKIYDKYDHSQVTDPIYTQLCIAASLNLKAWFTPETMHLPAHKRTVIGDASEVAILRYMESNRSATKIRAANPMVAEIPFDSNNKYQVTIHHIKSEDCYYLITKGAPEIILEFCATVYTKSENKSLTPETKNLLLEGFTTLANKGERLLGYCDLKLPVNEYPIGYQFKPEEPNFSLKDLQFLGVISLIDPPREEVRDALDICKQAGITVTMVTGDHPLSALSVARYTGIITQPTAYDYAFENNIEVNNVPSEIRKKFTSIVVTGTELRTMTTSQLKKMISNYREIAFARISPQQKLLIVETYQSIRHVVAVTGDGVNDAPALKQADIGIAMGISGSEVAKQAADVILMNDNFASIVLGIKEGRRIFDNLKKVVAYKLTPNLPEMMPFILNICFGIPMPISLLFILIIKMGIDLLPAMSLGYETPEEDIMTIPPRKASAFLVNRVLLYMAYFQIGLIEFCAGMYAYFCVFAKQGFFPLSLQFIHPTWEKQQDTVTDSYGRYWFYYDRKTVERKAQTGYFIAICWTQISNLLICKTRRVSLLNKKMDNCVLNTSIIVTIVIVLVVTYVPVCHEILSTETVGYATLVLPLPHMFLIILSDELRRYIIRHGYSEWIEKETYY